MIVIGLTGPTGAGKGVVGEVFARRGALVVDTDRIAREIVEAGSDTLAELAAAFGDEILNPDGSLDRAALAAKAFSSKDSQLRLNAITHPAIIRRGLALLEDSDAPLGVIDAPLLFESGMDRVCAVTVAVLAPKATRLERILRRDGLSEEAALRRMNAQHDDAFYRERATHTLINDGDIDNLIRATDALIDTIGEGRV